MKNSHRPMSYRIDFEGSSEIGAYMALTNTYCVVGRSQSNNMLKFLQENVSIPIVETTINSIRSVGSQCRGNKHGLLVPHTITDQEIMHIRNTLPENVVVRRIEERLNALGNVILCNDHVAIIHADLDGESEDLIKDVLQVPVYRHNIGHEPLVGTFGALNNQGMLVHPFTSQECQKELSELLEVNVIAGTVNGGSSCIGGGVVANDWMCIAGAKTTNVEMTVIESVFDLSGDQDLEARRRAIVDTIVR
ncbi:translation initiation factor 6 [Encephalitozoon hellem]|uniref:Eukaryotic translation initiation factor 6 n=2 Tax=Encephalitozoon hellem TaxID=27973 RepID=A0ABY8CJ15_ENCHE|nr:translation initiation factor 6 [Encephalitozoon hellem]WEL38421.1 eukaryotic translation initiation factor 6 [Encephalitozoon hellem]